VRGRELPRKIRHLELTSGKNQSIRNGVNLTGRGRALPTGCLRMKSLVLKPTFRDEGQYRVYTWNNAGLEDKDEHKQKQEQEEKVQQVERGQLPQPDMELSTFQTWDEVGLGEDSCPL